LCKTQAKIKETMPVLVPSKIIKVCERLSINEGATG